MDQPDTEYRAARRLALAMPARCRMVSGFAQDVVLRDISCGGCRIVGHALGVRPGAPVVIRPVGMEGLCGTVRWVSGEEAGIEFERPLYPPVAEHMHRAYATFLAQAVPYRNGAVRRIAA